MASFHSSVASMPLSLDQPSSLKHKISLASKPIIIENFWGHRDPSQLPHLEEWRTLDEFYDVYFRYYSQQCDLIGRHANGKYSSVETHHDIMAIAQLIQKPLTRQELRDQMYDILRPADEEQHDNSINLVARLLVMTKFGDVPHECLGGRTVEWNEGTFPEFVHTYFSRPSSRDHGQIKLEKPFNALNLDHIAGIRIRWTDNLADHLRMRDDDKAVEVFCHASFLEYQLDNPIFPPKFIEETLQTIALLFPKHDAATRKWFRRINSSLKGRLDSQVLRAGYLNAENRQIGNFAYWHDRLVILKEVYDEARPSSLSQWWYDRRNGPQWYTFWVAICVLALTIIFGLLQCAIASLQAYKAFHP